VRSPDFLYAGMPKAGSTWLYEALRANPDVFVPDAKGLDFFDRNFDRGIDWYLGHFAGAAGAKVAGELSHDTYACPEAPRRIREHFPDMRLIVCLREPGDAARSILQWWSTHTHAFGRSVESMTDHPHYRALLSYRANLERLLEEFDRSQLLLLFYEDLGRAPQDFLRDVQRFLGLDPSFEPPSLDRKVNVSMEPRHPALARLTYRFGGALRRVGAGRIVERAKAAAPIQRMLYGGGDTAVPSAEVRAAMLEAQRFVIPDFAAIAAIAGRDLPPEWIGRRPAE
jgi:hypothetical protein